MSDCPTIHLDHHTHSHGSVDSCESELKPYFNPDATVIHCREDKRSVVVIKPFRNSDDEKNVLIVWPKVCPLANPIDFSNKERTLHARVINTKVRSMLMERPLGHYVEHFKDPKFHREYNRHIMGLIWQWKDLVVPLIVDIMKVDPGATIERQMHWIYDQIDMLVNCIALQKDPSILLGSLRTDFMRVHVRGMGDYECACFLNVLASCSKYEIYTSYDNFRYEQQHGVSGWKIVTRVWEPKVSTGSEVETPVSIVKYAFGAKYDYQQSEE